MYAYVYLYVYVYMCVLPIFVLFLLLVLYWYNRFFSLYTRSAWFKHFYMLHGVQKLTGPWPAKEQRRRAKTRFRLWGWRPPVEIPKVPYC